MSGPCACRESRRPDPSAVLVKVRVGEIPRESSSEAGVVVKVDAATARELEADGRAVRVRVTHAG